VGAEGEYVMRKAIRKLEILKHTHTHSLMSFFYWESGKISD